ncbi:quinol:cytochrome C oxidoreductase [Botrimarina sp.]|uniref:quinol:cytochrome C oxidoreductase n=1 Tax=Botrimarina sp. TaxID=2795802 RepID=UPI0032ECE9BC
MATLVNQDINETRQASHGLATAGLAPGLIGLALLGVAAAIGYLAGLWQQFAHAYLLAVMYVTSLGVGGLFFVIGHHLTGGRWGTTVRRLAEVTAGTIWVSALLYIPILVAVLVGSDSLYPWAGLWVEGEFVSNDPILRSKSVYLEPTFFALRTVIYFGLWIWMSRTMLRLSVKQDQSDPMQRAKSMQWWAGPMVLIYALSMNFAAFDWMMSLEPHWFSTMFGVYFFTGSFGGALALTLLIAVAAQSRGALTQSVTTEHLHDLAKLMFAFVVFWGYIAFSQYLLIWYAAIPEETLWYDIRQMGIWPYWGLGLVFGHLLIPFLGFMSRAMRRNRSAMTGWAAWMLVVHWMDLAYLVLPQVRVESNVGITLLLGLLTTAGALGVFAWAWMSSAAGKWLLPVQDPRLPLALSYHNH